MRTRPAEKIEEYGKLSEDIYAWFLKEMGKPADYDLWQRTQGDVLGPQGQEGQGRLDDGVARRSSASTRRTLRLPHARAANFYFGPPRRASSSSTTTTSATRLIHGIGHFTIRRFSHGLQGTPAWLVRGMGQLLRAREARRRATSRARRSRTTAARAASSTRASSARRTRKDRCRGILREGIAEPMTNLTKLDLNSLNGRPPRQGLVGRRVAHVHPQGAVHRLARGR